MPNSNPGHKTIQAGDYEVTFHPAFASRCAVRTGENVVELFSFKGPHRFAKGEKHPEKHTLRLSGGETGRDLEIEVRDPRHQVARITIHLYPDGHTPGSGARMEESSLQAFEWDNGIPTCPPVCGDPDDLNP